MDKEQIGALILAIACIFMAGLNFWNLFKDWFDEKYQIRNTDNVPIREKEVPNIIGKSKFVLTQEMETRETRLEREVAELKKELASQKSQEGDKPFMSIPMKNVDSHDNELVDLEEEGIPIVTERERSLFDSGTTLDEFEAVVKVLKGNPLSHVEKKDAVHSMIKIKGTDIYNQLLDRIDGAKERALEALDEKESTDSEGSSGGFSGLDKYIRV
jgi:hypothetical protein